ncbi:MAG TPA: hypothetical protein VML36_06735 [Nitrospiria bacterium]|nr:hypothetical protein [Nitrospiria bacterium]
MTGERSAPSPHGPQPVRGYARSLATLLVVIGILQCVAWGFRAWVLYLLGDGDSWLIVHSVVTLISLGVAVLLLRIGMLTFRRRPARRDPAWIAASGLWIAGVGVHRLIAVITHPTTDPSPRAHLHLSVLFMVLGALLLGIAWFWRRNDLHSAVRQGLSA